MTCTSSTKTGACVFSCELFVCEFQASLMLRCRSCGFSCTVYIPRLIAKSSMTITVPFLCSMATCSKLFEDLYWKFEVCSTTTTR